MKIYFILKGVKIENTYKRNISIQIFLNQKKRNSKGHNKFKKNPVFCNKNGYVLLAGTSKISYAKEMGKSL